MLTMNQFLFNLFQTTLTQLLGVLGIFFVFGYLLYFVQNKTQQIYRNTIGWKGILWTAWIGTPIHELGHVVFAKIFGHKINDIALFRPNKETGNLGYVNHSYGRFALWGRIGNFFIGGAPLIFGSIFLVLMFRFLLPNGQGIFVPIFSDLSTYQLIIKSITNTLGALFAIDNLKSWPFWLFLYMSFCIASHLAPSKEDQKGMYKGLIWIILLLTITNAIFLRFNVDITNFIFKINQFLGIFIAIFTYALVISLLHLLFASIFLFPFRKK